MYVFAYFCSITNLKFKDNERQHFTHLYRNLQGYDVGSIYVISLHNDKWQDVDTEKGGWKQFLVYGTIKVKHKGNGNFEIHNDKYDFDMHSWNSLKEFFRNIETFMSGVIHGFGTPFDIKFNGYNSVR